MSIYTAKRGDIIWLDFNPHAGHEQKGRRPAVVISNAVANKFLNGRAMVCPISSTNKGYPVQPPLDDRTKTQGVVLCDQVMVLDMSVKNAEYAEQLPTDILNEVVDIIYGMMEDC